MDYDTWKLCGYSHYCQRCRVTWYDSDGGCACDELEAESYANETEVPW